MYYKKSTSKKVETRKAHAFSLPALQGCACDVLMRLPFAVAFLTIWSVELWAVPVVPGLHGNHHLDQSQSGWVLLGELGCMSCHKGDANSVLRNKGAPDLTRVGDRLSPDYLRRFIANPTKVRPGVTMPDLLQGKTATERATIADAITHFLLEKEMGTFDQGKLDGAPDIGRQLFHEIGCVACHNPRDEKGNELPDPGLLALGHLPQKYSQGSLSEFLFNPHRVMPAGRMPDFGLSRKEANDLAAYLMGPTAKPAKPLQVRAELVAKGRDFFTQLNCAACHSLGGVHKAKVSTPLIKLRDGQGCLSDNSKVLPYYDLSDEQRKAIGSALSKSSEVTPSADLVQETLVRFNCIACHKRDSYGGPSTGLLPYLKTSQEGLGNEARIPPPLTLAGAKLKPNWMRKVLFDGESVRPYMHTRMPKFSEDELRFLPALLAEVDKLEQVPFPEPERKDRGKIRQIGTQLAGDKGLNCITCHNFNGKDSPGFKGLDLITSYERLQPSWFYAFMRNPAAMRPGIVMPNYWAGGKGRPDILEGDAAGQIWAIWHYFSYGQGAHTPSGIHSPGHSLEVGQVVRTYRGRSRIAGYRGIAVGFPGGLNYAFNAETGTLSGLWKGDFISVGWGGQGSGNFNPKSRAVSLAQDLSFHALPKSDAPWPLLPVMNKENPVNPDPLYPKNVGYQFLGYSLDEDFVPTFSYRIGEITMEDKSVPVIREGKTMLNRTLSMNAVEPRTIHFRALVGKIEKVSDTSYKTPDLTLEVNANKATPNALRPLHAGENSFELLLNLALPKGKSALKLHYDLLR